MKRKLLCFLGGVLTFFAFISFSSLVAKDKFTQFDFDTTVRLQDHISPRLAEFFSYFSLLGSAEVTTLIFVLILLFPKNLPRRLLFLPAYFFVFLLGLVGKVFINHAGPPFMFYHYKLGFVFPSTHVQTGNSYPSGHSSRTIFLSIMLLFLLFKEEKVTPLKLLLALLILVFDGLTLLSRVYLGEHWTSDVVGGALLGASLGLLGGIALKSGQDKK